MSQPRLAPDILTATPNGNSVGASAEGLGSPLDELLSRLAERGASERVRAWAARLVGQGETAESEMAG
jgi:hypothetical protein